MNHYKKLPTVKRLPNVKNSWDSFLLICQYKVGQKATHTSNVSRARHGNGVTLWYVYWHVWTSLARGKKKIPFMLPWNLLKEKFVVLACKDLKNWLYYFSCKVVIFWTENQTFSPRNSVYRFQNVLLWPRCFWIYSFLFQGNVFWGVWGFQA